MNDKTRADRAERYTITQLCQEFDVTPRTLRFYEQKDLLHPERERQNRIFNYRDRARLQLILRGKKVGFSLDEIKEMLDLYELQDGETRQLQTAYAMGTAQLKNLEEQLFALEEAIADLKRGLAVTEGMLAERGVPFEPDEPQVKSA
ncbi:MAG: MerR family DNA-binding transcriptional regulator [Pseudomonadota bacterium]